MTKKLLVQIKNEWRNNLWLALELLVVSVVELFGNTTLYGVSKRSGCGIVTPCLSSI